jgi:hypothetical protein
MNEPDLVSQSNMTVDVAIKLWKKQMVPLASSKVHLLSPAVTGTLEGIQWLTEFVEGCSKCKISAVAVHWYDRADVSCSALESPPPRRKANLASPSYRTSRGSSSTSVRAKLSGCLSGSLRYVFVASA